MEGYVVNLPRLKTRPVFLEGLYLNLCEVFCIINFSTKNEEFNNRYKSISFFSLDQISLFKYQSEKNEVFRWNKSNMPKHGLIKIEEYRLKRII